VLDAEEGHVLSIVCETNKSTTVQLLCRTGSSQPELVVMAIVVFMDCALLRWTRKMHDLTQLDNVQIEDGDTDADVEEQTLLFDKRALRVEGCMSSREIFIPGTRFVMQWLLSYL
jgi:hypothetical protein